MMVHVQTLKKRIDDLTGIERLSIQKGLILDLRHRQQLFKMMEFLNQY